MGDPFQCWDCKRWYEDLDDLERHHALGGGDCPENVLRVQTIQDAVASAVGSLEQLGAELDG